MKKSIKGAIAMVLAAFLLLGGASSLAYWSQSRDVPGGSFTAGKLSLTAVGCDANWVYATGQAGAGTTVSLWVPGDVISKSCTYTVGATGDNLLATLVTPPDVSLTTASAAATTTGRATASVTYLLDGVAIVDASPTIPGVQISDSASDRTLTATFNVEFPYGDATTINANDTNNWIAAFNSLTVSLTQVDPNP